MKNKKMVATLASLCLIVVAVVAAVVGVLAAITQQVSSTMSVKYTAMNVDAIVTLKSLGPNFSSGTPNTRANDLSYASAEVGVNEQYTTTFDPMEQYQNVELKGKVYNFGWSSEGAAENTFLGVAIYQFKFENRSHNHNLSVTPVLAASVLEDANVAVKVYKSTYTTAELALVDISAEWDEDGDLDQGATATTFGIKSTSNPSSRYTEAASGTAIIVGPATESETVWTNTVMYVYMVVALEDAAIDMNKDSEAEDVTTSDLTGYISFTLTDAGLPS